MVEEVRNDELVEKIVAVSSDICGSWVTAGGEDKGCDDRVGSSS